MELKIIKYVREINLLHAVSLIDRRWVIKKIAGQCSNLQGIVGKESELVGRIAEV